MKRKKDISLERTRGERSETRRLAVGKTEIMKISIEPQKKDLLEREAKKRSLSLSLYVNLILTGQENSPL